MSKILRKILKTLILPASLMIISKATGIYLAALIFDLTVFLDTQTGDTFSIQIFFLDNKSTIIANSFSNVFMLITFTITTIYLIIKYWLSISSKYNPRTLVKLTNMNLISWVNSKDNTFLKVFVWLVCMWIVALLIINDILRGNTYEWIGILAIIVTIFSSWVLIRTFEAEIDNIYPDKQPNIY